MKQVFETYEDAFRGMVQNVMDYGSTVTVRDMETKELMHASFTIMHPQYRLNLLKHRNGNPFAQIAETLWMLTGRNDLDWLEKYIPQCKKWSDDGKTWRAAYGPRLRNWIGWKSVENDVSKGIVTNITDQVEEVLSLLQRDPGTRQAVISLFDPAQDWVEGSKDYPCNNWLHFMIRDGKLHLNVAVRSNDLMYGFSHVDFYGWSVLQQFIAEACDVGIGKMTWNASSLHVYAKHYGRAELIVHESLSLPFTSLTSAYNLARYAVPMMRVSHGQEYALRIFENNLAMVMNEPCAMEDVVAGLSSYADVVDYMLGLYDRYLAMDKDADIVTRIRDVRHIAHLVSIMPPVDAKYAAIEYFCRHIPGFAGALELSNDEYTWLHSYGVL